VLALPTAPIRRVRAMKADIHPKYTDCAVTCACGNKFTTKSVKTEIRTDICAACHPYFTGAQKFVDTAGRVDKFRKRYAKVADGTGVKA
jgi:large subunit ribosomal protein L31